MSRLFSGLNSQTGTDNPIQSNKDGSALCREARTSQSLSSFVLSSIDELTWQYWTRRIWPRCQDADLCFPNPNSSPSKSSSYLSSCFTHVKQFLLGPQGLHNISSRILSTKQNLTILNVHQLFRNPNLTHPRKIFKSLSNLLNRYDLSIKFFLFCKVNSLYNLFTDWRQSNGKS